MTRKILFWWFWGIFHTRHLVTASTSLPVAFHEEKIGWTRRWVVNYLNAADQLLPRKTVQTTEKTSEKNGCDWMALFELNMEFETWIAVDGHEVSQRFKIYVRGSIYLRIGTALNRNPRQAKPRWDVEQNSVTFLDTITDEDFFKGKTWHINSLSLVVTMEIRCEVFLFLFLYISVLVSVHLSLFWIDMGGNGSSSVTSCGFHFSFSIGWTFGASNLWLFNWLMQWRGSNMKQGFCRSTVWEIMQSHVVD